MASRTVLLCGCFPAAVLGFIGSPGCPGNTTASDVMKDMNFKDKVAIVTGGDSGLGYAMTEALARIGATVVIGNRNLTRGVEVAQNLSTLTGATVVAIQLDLSSLESVRSFAREFLMKFPSSLHLLVNNAGIGNPSVKTADGFELVFEVDYLGHFLLTESLLPALRSSRPSRVINVASGGHKEACSAAGWPTDCFKDWTYIPTPVVTNGSSFGPGPTYGAAKFLQIQHARGLALREAQNGVTASSLNPGFVLTSATAGFDPDSHASKAFCKGQAHPGGSLPAQACPFSADQGAAVVAFCATSSDVRGGTYYNRQLACEEGDVVTHGFTDAMVPELYRRSLGWAGLAPIGTVVV